MVTRYTEIIVHDYSKKKRKKFYDNIDISLVTDNSKFWKTIKPLFFEKHFSKKKSF